SRRIQIVKEPTQLMSISDILDHFSAPEAAFSEIALCSVAFLSPRAPLLRIHWPLDRVLSLPPHQRGQVVRKPLPAGFCPTPQRNWQRPNGARSRRAARPYSACHRNSAFYRTRQFLRTNRSVSP